MNEATNKLLLLGGTMREFARLECAIDEFLVATCERWPNQSPKEPIPLRYEPKVKRLVECFLAFPILRRFGFPDGSLHLTATALRLLEIFESRNNMAHGDLVFTSIGPDEAKFTFTRWVRDGNSTSGLRRATYITYGSFILYQRDWARALSRYFKDAIRHLKGKITPDYYNQKLKQLSRDRKWWCDVGQYANFANDADRDVIKFLLWPNTRKPA